MYTNSSLFEPILVGQIKIKNRIVMSPLSPNLASPDGFVTSDLINFYEERAKGGFGLIITGWSFVGLEPSRDPGIQIAVQSDRFIPSLNTLTEIIHRRQSKIFLQLSYIGRKLKQIQTVDGKIDPAASQMWIDDDFYIPQDLTREEIKGITDLFGKAAERAKIAGFDGVEIGATPGELPYSFMLKETNNRIDEYGGELDSRMLFPLEIISRIRRNLGKNFIIGFRYPGEEDLHYFNRKAIKYSEAVKIGVVLEDAGIDYLNIFRAMVPLYILERKFVTAEAVKRKVDIPVIATGSITDLQTAERLVADNKADLVALGRAAVADPEWPNKAYQGLSEDILFCIRCNECILRVSNFQVLRCTVNVNAGQESRLESLHPADSSKRIAIIGGGPSGIKASITATKRGHKVTIFEKREILGGNLIPGSRPDFKSDLRYLLKRLNTELKELPIEIVTNKKMTLKDLDESLFDVVIVAVGSRFKKLNITGENNDNVFSVYDAFCNPEKIKGKKVVVVGGGATGCEMALFLAHNDKKVEIVEMMQDILMEEQAEYNKIELRRMLDHYKINVHTQCIIEKIEEDAVKLSIKNGKSYSVTTDSVIITIGSEPDSSLYNQLEKVFKEVYMIGDCKNIGRLYNAIHDGYMIGALI